MIRLSVLLVVLLVSISGAAIAEEQAACPQSSERPACPECPACPEDEKKKDGWDVSVALGFNLTRGNSDTFLLTGGAKAEKEEGSNILRFEADGAMGEDDDRNDEMNGRTTQKEAKLSAEYKRLLSDKFYIGGAGNAAFDQVADVDYRYIISLPIGYFLIKEDHMKLNVEAGPSYVFEKLGGDKNEYFSPRVFQRFDWDFSDTSKFFQSVEALFSADDGDDTLVNAEIGVEAAMTSKLSLVLTVKNEFDNVPAEDRERNDLSVITALKLAL